jgi:hypothetical protein
VSFANEVFIEPKSNLLRCAPQSVNVTADVSQETSAIEFVLVVDEAVNCGFLEDLAVSWNLAADVLQDRFVDVTTHVDGNAPDTIRFAAFRNDAGNTLAAGQGVAIATIEFTTSDCCSGTASIEGGDWAYPNPTCGITTQFVDAASNATIAVPVDGGTVGIQNQAPTVNAVADISIGWGGVINFNLGSSDPDFPNGCETRAYSKVSGPAGLNVNAAGNVNWPTTGDDVCDHEVIVRVTDKCGATDEETFIITVTNRPPVITECPDDAVLCAGEEFSGQVVANDPDTPDGPDPLLYTKISGPSGMTVHPGTGEISWTAEPGDYEVCISVTDGANLCDQDDRNADTCCFSLTVRTIGVVIEKLHDVFQGQYHTVDINFASDYEDTWPIGGFDFLVEYDASVMSFFAADEGELYGDCAWEYFTYGYGPNGACGTGCPSGQVHIVGIAESNQGNPAVHPDCFGLENNDPDVADFAGLTFLVSNNRTYECQFAPIRFVWYDCADNSLSSVTGDTLYISRSVFDYGGEVGGNVVWNEITGVDQSLPTFTGAPDDCDVSDKGYPVRCVSFYNGGIDIVCADSIDDRGDLNLNKVAYEIADAVMYSAYFVSGLSVFEPHVEGSVAASDVNADGLPLSVADLVYLIRVVIGDALPHAKVNAVEMNFTYDQGVVSVQGEVAAAYVVVRGDASAARTQAEGMVSEANFDTEAGITRILVRPVFEGVNELATVTGELLTGVRGELVSIEMATPDGATVLAKNIPTTFALYQNYPNPFNPSTTISFDMPRAASYELAIYNVQGQLVETITGSGNAGRVNVVWQAEVASGVYFYKLSTDSFTETKKMVFLK